MTFITTPLPPKVIEHLDRDRYILINRVISFDPADVYARMGHLLNPHKRVQQITVEQMWPNNPGVCGCGCGLTLTGRRTRWATDLCSKFPLEVYWIIRGDVGVLKKYTELYWGCRCAKCEMHEDDLYKILRSNQDYSAPLYLDHIVPVKHGGGASWLSNYQLLCRECHQAKTNADFGWKQPRLDLDSQLRLI